MNVYKETMSDLRGWSQREAGAECSHEPDSGCSLGSPAPEVISWGRSEPSLLPRGFPGGSDGKASACNAGDPGSIPGSRRSPGEGNGNPLQHSCLENPMDGEARQATVHGIAKSRARLSDFTFSFFLLP